MSEETKVVTNTPTPSGMAAQMRAAASEALEIDRTKPYTVTYSCGTQVSGYAPLPNACPKHGASCVPAAAREATTKEIERIKTASQPEPAAETAPGEPSFVGQEPVISYRLSDLEQKLEAWFSVHFHWNALARIERAEWRQQELQRVREAFDGLKRELGL